ncbi:type II toxin-antitoxin system RelE/ParE family toxin [Pseudomonas sp. A25(2017)]|uniref:type II toxin-antitoxin system RelE family toxin n=1 Tax=Pseudomonas sp. A25(2017) TaxID=1945865 RepID=UPI0021140C5B|nr:hypothetical protein [Pseudomonas sp. A25(2017)]
MGVDYDVEWDPKALKELRKVDGAIRLQLLRFAMEPSAFLTAASAKVTAHIETVPLSVSNTSAHYVLHEGSPVAYSVEEAGASEYNVVTSNGRRKTAKEPDKG